MTETRQPTDHDPNRGTESGSGDDTTHDTLARLREQRLAAMGDDDLPSGGYHHTKLSTDEETFAYTCPCGYSGPKSYERHLFDDHEPADFGISDLPAPGDGETTRYYRPAAADADGTAGDTDPDSRGDRA